MSFLEIIRILSQGAWQTILVTLLCCITGLTCALVATCSRKLPLFGVAFFIDCFSYVFRGIPILVLLFLVYFGLPAFGIRCSPIIAMMCSLGLITGAYLSEVFRGAIDAVNREEILVAQSMGFSKIQIFTTIELPQTLRFAVPGMINEFTSVLKYSPFAYTVGISEITKQATTIAATTLQSVEIYLGIGLLYFAIYKGFLLVFNLIEQLTHVPGIGETL